MWVRASTDWEIVQHLIRALETEGETGAARLLARIGERGQAARDLAYRLYGICERKKWAEEALAYNGLVARDLPPRRREFFRYGSPGQLRALSYMGPDIHA